MSRVFTGASSSSFSMPSSQEAGSFLVFVFCFFFFGGGLIYGTSGNSATIKQVSHDCCPVLQKITSTSSDTFRRQWRRRAGGCVCGVAGPSPCSSSSLVHLLHVAVGRRRALCGVGEEIGLHLRGQSGWSFRIQVRPEQFAAAAQLL
ncbi:hypothetical protein JOB18_040177 [Solea senegalensis]|uniref:Secreted protein n=2 Tax=Solea senegalensis TaxID=28829 RepID=A0AAV6SSW8_SOLSE|nr:hypothetical protein JOB18_040177 [Solea senegalensis]